jgi:trimethylamine-N-oxide reductase (cytochrome c)
VQDSKVVRVRTLVADDGLQAVDHRGRGQALLAGEKVQRRAVRAHRAHRLYSKDRILTPMKRVDFDPNGKRNQQNRGKSGYEPIGWDEALDLVAGEIKRVQGTYGPSALTAMTSSHHNWGLVGYKISAFQRFFNLIGYTTVMDNPDSWEGWHWGATPRTASSGGWACPSPTIC